MNKLILASSILLSILLSCSKDNAENCGFNKEYFIGKTFTITKITAMGMDVISTIQSAQPCALAPIKVVSETEYTYIATSTCTNPPSIPSGVTWSLTTSNGKNYITIGSQQLEIVSQSCTEIVASSTINYNGTPINASVTIKRD